ncbi:MAG: hypothetical protein ACTHMI_05775 [Mucilaginibacter sp.]
MTDKDLLVVISEMLRKQDQQSEILGKHSDILSHHTEILNHHTEILERNTEILNKQIDVSNKQTAAIEVTNETLKEFMKLSSQQFLQQQAFNERFLDKLDEIAKKP